MTFDDTTLIRDLEFLSSHNSQQGRFQICVRPCIDHVQTCLDLGCRAIEIDVASRRHRPIAMHGPSPWGGIAWSQVCERIMERAFEYTDAPLILFVDDRTKSDSRALSHASADMEAIFGRRLFRPNGKRLADLTYGELEGRIVLVSFPRRTGCSAWDRWITESPYSDGFQNVPHDRWSKTSRTGGLIRVYPRNFIRSRNFDPRPMLGKANFVALNILSRGSHLNAALEHFRDTVGIRALKPSSG